MEFIVQNAIKQSENTQSSDYVVGSANIKVIGVGGAGGNAISWLYKKGIKGAEIAAINTDKQHLDIHEADRKILIGRDLTKGLGAGGHPHIGNLPTTTSDKETKEHEKILEALKKLALKIPIVLSPLKFLFISLDIDSFL